MVLQGVNRSPLKLSAYVLKQPPAYISYQPVDDIFFIHSLNFVSLNQNGGDPAADFQ